MNDKNTMSSRTVILVAIIGAFGAIFAACIGLIPSLLPIVQLTLTPVPFYTETRIPSDTPVPDTFTPTLTPTDLPTLTATLEPLPTDTPITETPTVTVTPIPPASDMQAYEGTWTNVKDNPSSDRVRLVVNRIEITLTGGTTADFSVCRTTQSGLVRYVEPNPAPASIYVLGLGAKDFVIPSFADLRWAIVVQRTADQMVATVQEYDMSNILLATDTFYLKKAGLLDPANFFPCQESSASN